MEPCAGCGACCINHFDDKWIEVSKYDSELIFKHDLQKGDILPYAMKQTKDGRCIRLDRNNLCDMYDYRPTICRKVRKGSKICRQSLERNINRDKQEKINVST
jgi:Fe-S-cluster containining protein